MQIAGQKFLSPNLSMLPESPWLLIYENPEAAQVIMFQHSSALPL